jgi:hypothetical protein
MKTKHCAGCQHEKPIEDFRWKQKAKGILASWCRTCDAERRAKRYDSKRQKVSNDAYVARRASKVAAGQILDGQPRTCCTCGQKKSADAFRWKNKRLGLRLGRCSECDRVARASDYKNKKVAYVARINRLHGELRQIVIEAKKFPCMDCGQTYPHYVMDFDHRDPTQKVSKVSNLMRLGSKKKLLAEIVKCDLVCANCHRERTFRRKPNETRDPYEPGTTRTC